MNENGTNAAKIIISIIFIVWFMGSLFGMMVCSKLDGGTGLMLALIGQYFLVFGIMGVVGGIKKRPFPAIILLFPLVGSALIICGVIMYADMKNAAHMIYEAAPYLLAGIFPVTGVLMIISATSEIRHLKRVCTVEVQAKCISVETRWTQGGEGRRTKRVHMPVYSVYYNGREYTVQNDVYTNMNDYQVGNYYSIMINPLNPEEFLDANNRKGNIVTLVLGIIFVAVLIPIIIYM